MNRKLIIAEKPSVAADIAKVVGARKKTAHAYENDDYIVSWAVGHLLEFLPPEGYDESLKRWRLKDLPIIPDTFRTSPVRGTTKQLNALKKMLRSRDVCCVVNGCDAGREGELIFQEIFRYSGVDKPVYRLWLQSMTPAAIAASLASLRDQSEVQGLADAADCRAETDWLIGMNATRALTVRLRSQRDRNVWSAGRVQTPTLGMLVRREREILAHEPVPYWMVRVEFSVPGEDAHSYQGTWFDPDADAPRDRIFDAAVVDRVTAAVEAADKAPAEETRRDRREKAPPMFDLTSLQREVNRRFGFSAKRALSVAQSLYEQNKLITYPRTDSKALPSDYRDHVNKALRWCVDQGEYAAHAERLLTRGLTNQERNFDDAAISDHFAIIPTGEGTTKGLNKDERRVFELIVARFLAAFHPPSVKTEVKRTTRVGAESFRTSGSFLKVPGWRAVAGREAEEEESSALPPLAGATDGGKAEAEVSVGELETEETETKPPARVTEARLLTLMETAGKEVDDSHLASVLKEVGGLGTPATRAETIETLLSREYAARCTGLDGKRGLRATPRGVRLIEVLERIALPRLSSAALTAELESDLRSVEAQEADRLDYMAGVRSWTTQIIDQIRGFEFDALYLDTPDVGSCPKCGEAVRESLRAYACAKSGRNGDCTFIVWKEVGGRYVDRRSAEQLLAAGLTPPKAGFFSRNEVEYEAALVLADDHRVEIRRRSSSGELIDVEPVDVGPCPFHPERQVRRTGSGYRCTGFADKECKLNLPLQLCQRDLAIEEVQVLIGQERKTALLDGFISKRNRPFQATLTLSDVGRIQWEFPERSARGGNGEAAKEFPVDAAPLTKCPRHDDAKIVETPTMFECTTGDCPVKLPREVCQRELSREAATRYFDKGKTEELEGFISKKGKPFTAMLYMKRTGRHGFRFPKK